MTFILAGKVGNEESYLLILAAKLSHAVCGVTRGISSDGRHLILGKCMRGRQYMPVVNLRLLRIVCHPQSHEYHMTLKLERRKGKEHLFILRKLCEYTMRIGEHMARSSKLGQELMIYAMGKQRLKWYM